MSPLRQILTTTGPVLTIDLPEAFQQRQVEVLVIDLEDAETQLPPTLDTPENRLKIREKTSRYTRLQQAMDAMSEQATANGLTEEILNEILADPE